MQHRCLTARRARGFTLVELMLVVGICLILLSLIVGAAMKGVSWVSQRNTETTFKKVLDRLNRHQATIINEARGWATPDAILAQANGDSQTAEVLKLKYIMKWSYPINYAEVEENYWQSRLLYSTEGYPLAVALRQQLLQKLEVAGAVPLLPPLLYRTSLTAAQQNSAILLALFELTRGSSTDEFAPAEKGQQASNVTVTGLQLRDRSAWLMDAWGSPICYIRNANLIPNYLAAQLGALDPVRTNNIPYNVTIQNWLLVRAQQSFQGKQQIIPPNFVIFNDPEDASGLLRVDSWLITPNNNQAAWSMTSPFPEFPIVLAPLWPIPHPVTTPPVPQPPLGRNRWCFRQRFFHDPLDPTNTNPNFNTSIYAPLVLFSAGADRNFDTINDNLESYGLRLTVGDNN